MLHGVAELLGGVILIELGLVEADGYGVTLEYLLFLLISLLKVLQLLLLSHH